MAMNPLQMQLLKNLLQGAGAPQGPPPGMGGPPPGMGGPPPGMGGPPPGMGGPPPGMGGPPPGMGGPPLGMPMMPPGAMMAPGGPPPGFPGMSGMGGAVRPGARDQVSMMVAQAVDLLQEALGQIDPADERADRLASAVRDLSMIITQSTGAPQGPYAPGGPDDSFASPPEHGM